MKGNCSITQVEEIIKIELRDIQGLYGGQALVINSSGEMVTRIVRPGSEGLLEERYRGSVDANRVLRDLNVALLNHYQERRRPGLPDEARPTINITLRNGELLVYEKWANDQNDYFDEVYQKMLAMIEAKKGTLVYKGPLAKTL